MTMQHFVAHKIRGGLGPRTLQVERPLALHLWRGAGDPSPSTRFIPGDNLFREDSLHDWSWYGGELRYHGAASLRKDGSDYWIVLQYGIPDDLTCAACSGKVPYVANFCPECGASISG